VDLRGLSFPPGEPLLISLNMGTAPFHVRVVVTDEADVLVRSARAETRFRSEPSHVEVDVAQGDTLEVRIPRGASRVELRTGPSSPFTWNGGVPRSDVVAAPDGSYLFPVMP
jgi:hypothetical protein